MEKLSFKPTARPYWSRSTTSAPILFFAATAEWWGLNPETGKLRWFAEYNLPGNMSNTTHLSGDTLTVSGGFPRTARVAIKTGGTGDLSDKILYDTQKPATYMTITGRARRSSLLDLRRRDRFCGQAGRSR